jgi:hypothetical protein
MDFSSQDRKNCSPVQTEDCNEEFDEEDMIWDLNDDSAEEDPGVEDAAEDEDGDPDQDPPSEDDHDGYVIEDSSEDMCKGDHDVNPNFCLIVQSINM